MNRNALIATVSVCATTIVVSGIVAHAGNLNPSPGPVSPTGPTVIDALPFTASVPGAYVLRSDLTVVIAQFKMNGISITASDVTIDLGGFSVIGIIGAATGIISSAGLENICIKNGTVREWPGDGVNLVSAPGSTVENIRSHSNVIKGIEVGDSTVVKDCIITNNTDEGLLAGAGALVTNCSAQGNGGTGINVGPTSVVTNCSASGHAGRGVLVGDACTLRDVIATGNGASGIETGATCVVTHCTAKNNGAAGIVLGNDSTATACSASNNGANGFFGGFGVTIESCTAQLNGNDGFRSSTGSSIRRCTSRGNDGDGIEIVTDCIAMYNNCSVNGQDPLEEGAGINATSNNNRIESNHLVGNTRGIRLAGTGTYINDNTVRANTLDNYDLVVGNLVNILLCEVHETIEVPASVKLGGTLIGTDTAFGAHGIRLIVSDITVDLGGHALIAIDTMNAQTGISGADIVRNGFIRNWDSWAINGFGAIVSDVVIVGNNISNAGGINERCIVDEGAVRGEIVSHCISRDSPGRGFLGGIITECIARDSNLFNSQDIEAIRSDVVLGCVSTNTSFNGIEAELITNSYAGFSGDAGITSAGLIRGNRLRANGSNYNNLGGATIIENDTD